MKQLLALFFIMLCLAFTGPQTAAQYPTSFDEFIQFREGDSTFLRVAVDDNDTSFNVQYIGGWNLPENFLTTLQIGSELMVGYRAGDNTITITERGAGGTVAAAHPKLALVKSVWASPAWQPTIEAVANLQFKLGLGSGAMAASPVGSFLCHRTSNVSAWDSAANCGLTLSTISGTLAATKGGTGFSSYTAGATLYATNTTTLAQLGIGSAGKIFRSDGSAPTWSTATFPNTVALGDTFYGSTTNVWSALAGNTTGTKKFLRSTGSGGVATAPAWDTLVAGDIPDLSATYQPLDSDLTTISGLTATTDNFMVAASSAWASRTPTQAKTSLSLNNVENTALSTWAGTANITTLGTISTGTWSASTIAATRGGTGLTSFTQGDILYSSASNTLAALAKNTSSTRYLSNTGASNNPAWAQIDLSNGVTGDLPFANLTQGAALTVLANATNGTADFAALAAASDNQVLRRSGTALAFGAVNLASSNAVTGSLPIANGGTAATTADAGLTNLGVLRAVTTTDYTSVATKAGTDMTGLSLTVASGGTYVGEYVFIAKDDVAADGLKFAIGDSSSTATMTSFTGALIAIPPVSGIAVSTSLASTMAGQITVSTASTGYAIYVVKVTMVVNAGGTIIPQLRQAAHTTGTATVKAGSFAVLYKVG